MQNPNGRHTAPTDERNYRPGHNDDQRFTQDDDRYGRTDRPAPRAYDHDDGGFRTRDDQAAWRQSDQYGQGQSGYTAGRTQGDPSLGFQSRNQGYAGQFDDHGRTGDDRWSGRGGSAYWQPERGDRGGYDPQASAAASKRRHNVGNYGYGSDSYGAQGGSMYDQNQGVGQQGHFGGSPGGYGHVGSYGAEGGAYNHGNQGWQGNQSWEGQQPPQRLGYGMTQGTGYQSPDMRSGGHRGKGPKNFQRSDERIREAVSEALEIHDDIDATHVDVLVKGGEVTLSGTVEDRHAKRLAEDITAAVSGVRDVQNQLRVGSNAGTGNHDRINVADATDPKKARA